MSRLNTMVDVLYLCSSNSATPVTPARIREILAEPGQSQPIATPGVRLGKPRIAAAKRAAIAEQYAAGKSSIALAKEHGISKPSVLVILRDHNVVVRKPTPLSKTQVARAAEAYEQGQSLAQIAKPLNVSPGTVRKALIAAGIEMRPRPGR